MSLSLFLRILFGTPNLYQTCPSPPAVQPPMDPEDEELLRDDEVLTPIKPEGIKKKERPTDRCFLAG